MAAVETGSHIRTSGLLRFSWPDQAAQTFL